MVICSQGSTFIQVHAEDDGKGGPCKKRSIAPRRLAIRLSPRGWGSYLQITSC